MDRSRHDGDSFSEFQGPGAPFLHVESPEFGLTERDRIIGSFVAAGRRLRSNLLHLVDDLRAGRITPQAFAVNARSHVRAAFYVAYSLGAISIFPFYTLTDRDVEVLDRELNEETGFLRQFGFDIARGKLDFDPALRSQLYLLALRGIFERGRTEAMPAGPYRWTLGITEHCDNCKEAASGGPYQRHLSDGLGLPILPGSPGDGSVCLGLTRCGCTIELESGLELPNQDLADRMRGLLLEVAYGSSSSAGGS
jgi:hypothetical protein